MPNTKISALTAGDPALGTDQIPIARSGANFQVTAASIAALSPAGTVTSVGGTGTVNGLTLTGTVTSSGNLTLGGTLSGVSLTTQVSGTLPLLNGGTGQTTKAAAFNALSPVTTTGDLIIGNGSNSNTRLAIGASGRYLVSNGSTASWQALSVSAGSISGTVQTFQGGTGTTTTPSNGQLLIGNGGGYTVAALTAGTGISITSGFGSVTIAASGGGGPTVQSMQMNTSSGIFNSSGSPGTYPLLAYTSSGSNYGAGFFPATSSGNYLPGGPNVFSIDLFDGATPYFYTSGSDFSSPPTFTVFDNVVSFYGLQIFNTAMGTLFSDTANSIATPSFAPLDASNAFAFSNPQVTVSHTSGSYSNTNFTGSGLYVSSPGAGTYLVSVASNDTTSNFSLTITSMDVLANSSFSSYFAGSDFTVGFSGNLATGLFQMQISVTNPTLQTLLDNSIR